MIVGGVLVISVEFKSQSPVNENTFQAVRDGGTDQLKVKARVCDPPTP